MGSKSMSGQRACCALMINGSTRGLTDESPRNHQTHRSRGLVSNKGQGRSSAIQASRQARARHGSWPGERGTGPDGGEKHSAPGRTLAGRITGEGVMRTYLIVIGKTSTGYSAHCPDVLGCAAVGKTVEAVVAKMKKGPEFYFRRPAGGRRA